jgi:hypothetical protein
MVETSVAAGVGRIRDIVGDSLNGLTDSERVCSRLIGLIPKLPLSATYTVMPGDVTLLFTNKMTSDWVCFFINPGTSRNT